MKWEECTPLCTLAIALPASQPGEGGGRAFRMVSRYKGLLCYSSSVLNIWWLFCTMAVPNSPAMLQTIQQHIVGRLDRGKAAAVWGSAFPLLLRQVHSLSVPSFALSSDLPWYYLVTLGTEKQSLLLSWQLSNTKQPEYIHFFMVQLCQNLLTPTIKTAHFTGEPKSWISQWLC